MTDAAVPKPTLEIVNISKMFGGAHVLSGVTITVTSGTVLGLIGPNGAGKTTLLNIVSGFLKANEGEVRYQGARIDRLPAHRIAALPGSSRPRGHRRSARARTARL